MYHGLVEKLASGSEIAVDLSRRRPGSETVRCEYGVRLTQRPPVTPSGGYCAATECLLLMGLRKLP